MASRTVASESFGVRTRDASPLAPTAASDDHPVVTGAEAPQVVAAVVALWRFPVKSIPGERTAAVEVEPAGVVGDRAYALVDVETGKVMSAKTPGVGEKLFGCRATFVDPPEAAQELPPVQITLPDGSLVMSDAPRAEAQLSEFLGRRVRLARSAPADFTIDQYHPDVEDADPDGHRDTVTESKLGSAFFADAGLPSVIPDGSFLDLFPVSVMTTSTIERLSELRPQSQFDERRFRMNVILATRTAGFLENDWIGRLLKTGDDAALRVWIPDPRCVMTTLAQDDLPRDTGVLRTLVQHNRIDVAGRLYPCAGVYATVESPGVVRVGDTVTLA